VPDIRMHRSGAHSYQHLAVSRSRRFDFPELEGIE